MTDRINLTGEVTIASLEQLLHTQYRPSLKRRHVTFDLTAIETIGLLPAALIYSWAAHLRRGTTSVRFDLPQREQLVRSGAAVLLESGVLQQLHAVGCEVAFYSPSAEQDVPMEQLAGPAPDSLLDRIASQIRASSSEFPENAVRDLCHGALFELLENAVVHGRDNAYFVARTIEPKPSDPLVPNFRQATAYIELAVGDLGSGIHATLAEHMPEEYVPPFTAEYAFSHAERVVTYAFEYGSTSSTAARLARLRKYHADENLDHRRVATGLSCVLNIVRVRHGQLIVRTGDTLLSFDFWKGTTPQVRTGRSALPARFRALAPVVGTHYLIRFPARRLSLPTGYSTAIPESAILDRIEVIHPFPDAVRAADEPDRVNAAVEVVDAHIRDRRNQLGITIIRPSKVPLTSRGGILFGTALASLHRGSRHILCLETYAGTATAPPSTDYAPPPAHDAGVILEGDLFSDSFHAVAPGADVPEYLARYDGNQFRINDVILARARRMLGRAIADELSALLRRPQYRLTNGPFLIEGQYYTNVFYMVATAATTDPYYRSLFEQWIASVIPHDCTLLLAATRAVSSLVEGVARLLAQVRGTPPVVLTAPAEGDQHVDLGDSSFAIVTDVICRGAVLNAVASGTSSASLRGVVTLVDARPADSDPDWVDYRDATGAGRRTTLWSLARDPLPTFSTAADAVAAQRSQNADLQFSLSFKPTLKIIDPTTHRPTVYVRDGERPRDFKQLLEAARSADALLYGHVLHDRRHYAVFLHFERLFQRLKEELARWVHQEVLGIGPAGSRSQFIVADTDGSLGWLASHVTESYPATKVTTVSWDDLRAPIPPAAESAAARQPAFIMLPGSASGDLARRCLEYASREFPSRITLMIAVARIEPSHLSFLLGITQYREIPVRVTCYTHLPVRAYPDALTCPLCVEYATIQRLHDAAPDGPLREVLQNRLAVLRPVDLGRGIDTHMFVATDAAARRIYLRALYEASEYDLGARRELTALLDRDLGAVDDFLEVIAAELRSDHFSLSTLQRRLLATYDRLQARASDILVSAAPPESIAAKVTALAHLAETGFLVAVPRLLTVYRHQSAEVEELCILLAKMRVLPVPLASDNIDETAAVPALLLATADFIRTPPGPDEASAFVMHVETLWSRLVRSSLVTERIPRLQFAAARTTTTSEQIKEIARYVYDGWKAELGELLGRLYRNRLWTHFAQRHEQLVDDIGTLASAMNDVRRLADGDAGTVTAAARFAATADAVRKRVGRRLANLFTSPIYSAFARLPDDFETFDGQRIHVTKAIDYDVPLVFGDAKALNDVCGEVVTNWKKHNRNAPAQVAVSIYRRGVFVCFQLEDDLPGEIDIHSKGGVRVIREFCVTYGGEFWIEPGHTDGWKRIILSLRIQNAEQAGADTLWKS